MKVRRVCTCQVLLVQVLIDIESLLVPGGRNHKQVISSYNVVFIESQDTARSLPPQVPAGMNIKAHQIHTHDMPWIHMNTQPVRKMQGIITQHGGPMYVP